MTIALDTEIVATSHDPANGDCYYTIERNGKRWTAKVHVDKFNQIGTTPASLMQRRQHLAQALEQAMMGPPDA